jgi:hypothetical protein
MDISFVFLFVIVALVSLAISLIGRKWSAIISYVIFGPLVPLCLFGAYAGLSQPAAGPSHSFAIGYLWVAAFAAVMVATTYVVYRYRQRKATKKNL